MKPQFTFGIGLAALSLCFSGLGEDQKAVVSVEAIESVHETTTQTFVDSMTTRHSDSKEPIFRALNRIESEKAAKQSAVESGYSLRLIGLTKDKNGIVYQTPNKDEEVVVQLPSEQGEIEAVQGVKKEDVAVSKLGHVKVAAPAEGEIIDVKIETVKTIATSEAVVTVVPNREVTGTVPKASPLANITVVAKTGDIEIIPNPISAKATSSPDEIDQLAIERFRSNPQAVPQIVKVGDKLIAHGAILASKTQCSKCHEVKKDDLLGLFRYEFEGDVFKVSAVGK